jgi:hypothetical protein
MVKVTRVSIDRDLVGNDHGWELPRCASATIEGDARRLGNEWVQPSEPIIHGLWLGSTVFTDTSHPARERELA